MASSSRTCCLGLRDKYVKDGKLRILYFYYPSEGPKAAVAAACASRQGKFWEFADCVVRAPG